MFVVFFLYYFFSFFLFDVISLSNICIFRNLLFFYVVYSSFYDSGSFIFFSFRLNRFYLLLFTHCFAFSFIDLLCFFHWLYSLLIWLSITQLKHLTILMLLFFLYNSSTLISHSFSSFLQSNTKRKMLTCLYNTHYTESFYQLTQPYKY